MGNPSREEMFKPGVTTPMSTFSIVVGDTIWSRCSAKCPFCISRMNNTSGSRREGTDQHRLVWSKSEPAFKSACRFAKTSGVTTVLFTGKGEPTLYKDEIQFYLNELQPYEFPFIEIQTNGIAIANGYSGNYDQEEGFVTSEDLAHWRSKGLTHIAISIAHWDSERNNEIYGSKRGVDLDGLITNLNLDGFSVRVCCLLMKDYVDSVDDFRNVVGLCNGHGARQLKITPIFMPTKSESQGTAKWVEAHLPEHNKEIVDHIIEKGHYLRTLPHGAPIFDYEGLSVCVSDCLPKTHKVGNGMQPIFWPDGSLTYSWEWRGAVLM